MQTRKQTQRNEQLIVPISPFRRYRKSIPKWTKTRQRLEAGHFTENFEELKDLWNSSVKAIEKYDFNARFHGNRRKDLPPPSNSISEIKRTTDAASYFKKYLNSKSRFPDASFTYLDREIATLRTPKAFFSDGSSACTSGRGGMDLLLMSGQYVCAGEVKIRGDSELFGALLQVMWYGSEIATANQIARVKSQYTRGDVECSGVDLAIFSIEQSKAKKYPTKDPTRDSTLKVVAKINEERSGFSRLHRIHLFENNGNEWLRIQ